MNDPNMSGMISLCKKTRLTKITSNTNTRVHIGIMSKPRSSTRKVHVTELAGHLFLPPLCGTLADSAMSVHKMRYSIINPLKSAMTHATLDWSTVMIQMNKFCMNPKVFQSTATMETLPTRFQNGLHRNSHSSNTFTGRERHWTFTKAPTFRFKSQAASFSFR